MARRTGNIDKEFDTLQKLKFENKKLKRQISSLRKQLARIDVDRYQNLQELVDHQYKEELKLAKKETKEDLIKKWQCHKCQEGYLRIIILSRPDGAFYFRKCTECDHRTKLQKYVDSVEGIRE